MADRLIVSSGETYEVPAGATEEYDSADIDGTLEVNGTLKLIDSPNVRPGDKTGLSLPTGPLNITSMNIGFSVFIIGILGVMWAGVAFVRAYAAGIVLAFAMLTLLLSGVFSIGLEVFYMVLALSILLLIAGVVVQWTR